MKDTGFDLIGRIRYQCLLPRVTTMGYCPTGCGTPSRGAGVCAACLAKELAEYTGEAQATHLVVALNAAQAAIWSAEDAVDAWNRRATPGADGAGE